MASDVRPGAYGDLAHGPLLMSACFGLAQACESVQVMGCFTERTYMLTMNPHITNWVPIAVPLLGFDFEACLSVARVNAEYIPTAVQGWTSGSFGRHPLQHSGKLQLQSRELFLFGRGLPARCAWPMHRPFCDFLQVLRLLGKATCQELASCNVDPILINTSL